MKRDEFDLFNELISNSFLKNDFPSCFQQWEKAQSLLLDKFISIPSRVKDIDPYIMNDLKAYKRFTDAIIWNFVRNEAADIRRFYNEEDIVIQNLKSHNIDSHLRYAENMKKEYGDLFIISDLLSNSKFGDVLWLGSGGKIVPIEIKDGEVNKRILSAIKEKNAGNAKEYESLINDQKYQKQIARIERQALRYNHESNLYYDEFSIANEGLHRIVTDHSLEIKTYEKELVDLLNMIELNGEGFIKVEECLFLLGIQTSGGRQEFLSEKLKELNPKSHKIIINCFSKDVNERPIAKPVLAFDVKPDLKFKILNSNFFVLQAFLPEMFCYKYSNDKIQFKYHEKGNDFFISTTDLNSPMPSGLGPGTYHRLFNFLQSPETIYKTSQLAHEEFLELNSNGGISLEDIEKRWKAKLTQTPFDKFMLWINRWLR